MLVEEEHFPWFLARYINFEYPVVRLPVANMNITVPDPAEAIVDKMASDLGLQKVGWIFTDLVADDVRKGTVKHLRDINTHFLTAEEL